MTDVPSKDIWISGLITFVLLALVGVLLYVARH